MQQLVDQVVQLGKQVTALQAELSVLKAQRKDSNWCGRMDKTQMMPDKFEDKKKWKDWAEDFVEYVEEIHPAVAVQLERAKNYQETIVPTYPTADDRKLAKAVYKLMKKYVREADGRRLVKSFKNDHNIYEVWRLLWFQCRPEIAAAVAAEAVPAAGAPAVAAAAMAARWWGAGVGEKKK